MWRVRRVHLQEQLDLLTEGLFIRSAQDRFVRDLGGTLLSHHWIRSCSPSPPPSRSCWRTALTPALPQLISDLLSMAAHLLRC